MDIVTIDFETFYAADYTLSKLTTEEYIRDARFEVIGVSVKVNDHETDWFSGTRDQTKKFLNSLDYTDKAILCHHTAFDGLILSEHFDIRPKFWFDTMSMAKPKHSVTVGGSLKNLVLFYRLGEKGTEVANAIGKRRKDFTPTELAAYGHYCCHDGNLTWELFRKLSVGFPVSELMVIDQMLRMYTEPVIELNRFVLEDHLSAVQERKLTLLKKLGDGDPDKAKKLLGSNVRFAALLSSMGAVIPYKESPATGKPTFAFAKTDPGMRDLLDHENPAVRAVTEVRLGIKSTIEETRTQRLIDVAKRGPLPVMLKYYAAHTGRFGGGDKLNLQNLPARKGNVIRTSLCAPDDCKLVVCDSSQIEARMLSYIAGQHSLTEAFRRGEDVYKQFAALIYSIPQDQITKEQRFVGKTCILGLGYGMGQAKFRETIKIQAGVTIDEAEAKRIVYLYRSTYPMIKRLWNICDGVLSDMINGQSGTIADFIGYGPEGIVLPNKMMLRYHSLQKAPLTNEKFGTQYEYISDIRAFRKLTIAKVTNRGSDKVSWTNIYGGKVTENIIQALARIVVTDQMTVIGQTYHVVLQVHDEVVVSVPAEKAKAAQQLMEHAMSLPPVWAVTLPVACESGIGANYGEAK